MAPDISKAVHHMTVTRTIIRECHIFDLLRIICKCMLNFEICRCLKFEYLKNLQIAADAGIASACGHLGSMYAYGKGVEKNDEVARAYYESAVKLGDMESEVILAQWLIGGRGGAADPSRAFELNMKSAQQRKVPIAMYSLGVHYQMGEGVEQDYGEALMWYSRAADGGVPPACANAGNMFLLGVGVHVDMEKAAEFFKKGADLGNPECKELYDQTVAAMKKKH